MKRRQFDLLVEEALQKIPRRFRDALENVEIVVEDWPDPDVMEEVNGDPESIVYGLFTGTPITERSFSDWGDLPAMIHIYQKPLEEDFPDRRDLVREIEITLVHEIAHFMGFDENTLREYGYD
jgi:predicted Zn-dependent protease with MMP-like domain